MDIGMENLYVDTGARRVKETSGRRGLANPRQVLLAKDLPSTVLCAMYISGADPGNFVANYFSQRQPHVLNL